MNKKQLQKIIFNLTPLITADIKLTEAIKLLLEISNKKEKNKIQNLLNKIENGKSLVYSFKELSNDKVFLNYILMIEKGANIKEIFSILNEKFTNEEKIKKEILSVVSYPLIVLFLAICVFFAIIFLVLPRFINIYESLDISIPIYTKVLIYINQKIHIFLVSFFIFLILIVFLIKKNIFFFSEKILKVKIIKEFYLFKFLQNMKYLLEAKIDFLLALKLSKELNNQYLYKILDKIEKEVSKGKTFSLLLNEYEIFNSEFIGIIKVGEKSSNYLNSFDKLYEIYNFRLDMKIKLILKLLEPISILIIAVLIAFTILAIMLPIFNLGNKI